MIKVSLDEGYVFDMLAISLIKSQLSDAPYKRKASEVVCKGLLQEIAEQIGEEKLKDIVRSEEYQALCGANRKTFSLVEIARAEKGTLSKQIDEANLQRYYAKTALQKNMFGTTPLETKTQIPNE